MNLIIYNKQTKIAWSNSITKLSSMHLRKEFDEVKNAKIKRKIIFLFYLSLLSISYANFSIVVICTSNNNKTLDEL